MVRITDDDIDKLPDTFRAYTIATFLQCDQTTITYWLNHNGLPHIKSLEGLVVTREDFREWCRKTGRLKDKIRRAAPR